MMISSVSLALLMLGTHLTSSFVVQIPGPPAISRQQQHSNQCDVRVGTFHLRAFDEFGDFEESLLSPEVVAALTVPQLKQQLRLRGLKVSGKKQELIDRLLSPSSVGEEPDYDELVKGILETDILSEAESKDVEAKASKSKARELAEERGKELIDVTAFLDEDDKGKTVKSSDDSSKSDEPDAVKDSDIENQESQDEVWGAEAKIVDDFEGKTPVVDALSRTIIEFRGSNRTEVQAYVIASRDALKPFLYGGKNRTGDPEDRLREIQTKREMAAKRPMRAEEEDGIEEGDETGIFTNILHRDFTDWGKFSLTGAQLSAQEVQGVLFLSDVYGPFTDDTKTLAEKIAFECQPVVVMVPDLFRGNPWKEDSTTPGFNEDGQDYEEWRSQHSDLRVSIDIRAAAAVLREQYGVSSVVVWGTCFGGGRALEIAAGYLPGDQVHDVDGTIGPAAVEPEVAVAWYPTRYDASALFGAEKDTASALDANKERSMAVMAVFGGEDKLAGATPEDAANLKALLDVDPRVKDYMVKVFPQQGHGFAHSGLGRRHEDSDLDRFVDDEFGGAGRVSMDGSDAEVACLLSTAFMETYSRVFLPTTGPTISKDERSADWADDLSMKDIKENTRDVRQEIEESLSNFKEEPLSGNRIDPTNDASRDQLAEILRSMESEDVPPELKIQPDDDLEEIYSKLIQADDSFQIF
jgi:dienelactone hydrolase